MKSAATAQVSFSTQDKFLTIFPLQFYFIYFFDKKMVPLFNFCLNDGHPICFLNFSLLVLNFNPFGQYHKNRRVVYSPTIDIGK